MNIIPPSASLLPVCFLPICLLAPLQGEIRPAPIFGSHMVLQRNQPIPFWGAADPGETVTVSLSGESKSDRAGADGKWMVRLKPQAAAENREVRISGSRTAAPIVFGDVGIGEVWLCSGQSNMAVPLPQAIDGEAEVAAADHPKIRLFFVKRKTSFAPLAAVEGEWRSCAPSSARNFSAIGYFFAREIQPRIGVPVGLIESDWGGTPAETWMRLSMLRGDPDYREIVKRREAAIAEDTPDNRKKAQPALDAWNERFKQLGGESSVPDPTWFDPAAEGAGWMAVKLPGPWYAELGKYFDGALWERKVFEAPLGADSSGTTLFLGEVRDYDRAWVNGRFVGSGASDEAGNLQRCDLPAGLIRPGKNVIVLRVVGTGATAGFPLNERGTPRLQGGADWSVPLAGVWQYRIGRQIPGAPILPGSHYQSEAGMLYDGMIAPLVPYGIRGVLWYQGEGNSGRAAQYRKLFPDLIRNWRQNWGQGDFPFYFVQLASFRPREAEPGDAAWAELREAQLKTLALPNTGMAVAIDIGDADTIHPRDKQDVGKRLSLWARAKIYGEKDLVYSGPLYRGRELAGRSIRIDFDYIGGGLLAKGGFPLRGFTIAGADRKFVWAEAAIVNGSVVVSSPSVPEPVSVRYDWAVNPDGNLFNAEGLPASPFRTDNWPGITDGMK